MKRYSSPCSLLELQPTTPAEIEQPDTTFSFANMNSVPTEGPATPTPAVVTHERKETKLTTWKREAEEKVAKGESGTRHETPVN